MKLLKQTDFLYGLEWGEKIGNMFAEVLADQALMGTFHINNVDNNLTVTTAQYVIIKSFNTTFSVKTCWRQIAKLKKRHKVFSWLLSLDGVRYDQTTNRVHVQPTIWRSIVKIEVFANAYEKYGDPCLEWLKILFGAPPVMPPQPVLVSIHTNIVIIDSEDNVETNLAVERNNSTSLDAASFVSRGTSYWNNVALHKDDSDSENSPSFHTTCSSSNSNSVHGTPTKPMAPPPHGWSPWKN